MSYTLALKRPFFSLKCPVNALKCPLPENYLLKPIDGERILLSMNLHIKALNIMICMFLNKKY